MHSKKSFRLVNISARQEGEGRRQLDCSLHWNQNSITYSGKFYSMNCLKCSTSVPPSKLTPGLILLILCPRESIFFQLLFILEIPSNCGFALNHKFSPYFTDLTIKHDIRQQVEEPDLVASKKKNHE